MKNKIEDILSLVEQNFEFLHVGLFLNDYVVNKENLASKADNLTLSFPSGDKKEEPYTLQKDIIQEALSQYHKANTATVFGYLIEWNAIRGVCMAMKEGIKTNSDFKKFIKGKLGDKFHHYDVILSFIRNVLSHNIDDEIKLKDSDYEGTKCSFLQKLPQANGRAKLSVNYSKEFPKMNPPDDYGFFIEIDFNKIAGQPFTNVISEWHLFMFTEYCYNLVKDFWMSK